MNTYQNNIVMMLVLIIDYKIQCICGREKGSSSSLNNPELLNLVSQYLGTLPDEQKQTILRAASNDMTYSIDRFRHDRLSWWNSLNAVIDDFVREFERQHQASKIRVDRRLKTMDWPISADDGFAKRYRLDFSFQTNSQPEERHSSVIVSMPNLDFLYEQGKELMVYDKEKYIFENVLPLMYRSWEYEKHSPNFYAYAVSGTLINENLNDGSRVVKTALIDSVEECKSVFKALAQFHALSVAQLDETVYSKLDSLNPADRWVSNALASHAGSEILTQYTKIAGQLLPRNTRKEIKDMTQNLNSILESLFSTDHSADSLTVVLQGSPQRINLFFELDQLKSSISQCKFFDFRFSRLGSPVLDLMAFLQSSIQFEIFAEKGDSLFEYYLEELHKNLADLNCVREYNLTMLRADLRRFKGFFIYSLLNTVPLQWINQQNLDTAISVEELLKRRVDVFKSKSFLPFLKNWMDVLSKW